MKVDVCKLLFFAVWVSVDLVHVACLSRAPHLQCLNDSLRLHFVPEGYPFTGHVYVKGFFYSSRCHLDYTQYSMAEPFFFHIPFLSDCQVKRERVNDPNGVSYSVVVVVQHHRLFVTALDKAYSVSCFYRDTQSRLENAVEIGDLTTQVIRASDGSPTCTYNVLQGTAQGQPAKFANIGEVLIHSFSCDNEDMGILVHSCYVRDGIGNEFALINDRGCSTDTSLVVPLEYTEDLTSASAPIAAFKFADQMIVYFTCQITLCNKNDNGCEGITPPFCQYLPLPNEDDGYSLPVVDEQLPPYGFVSSTPPATPVYPYVTVPYPSENTPAATGTTTREPLTFVPVTPTAPPAWPTTSQPSPSNYGGSHMPGYIPPGDYNANTDAGYSGGGNGAYYGNGNNPYSSTNGLGSTTIPTEPQPQPLNPGNGLFFGGFAASRHARDSDKNGTITLGVTADQLIIFAKDEKEPKNVRQKEKSSVFEANFEAVNKCEHGSLRELILIAVCIGTVTLSVIVVIVQNCHYRKRLEKCGKNSDFNSTFELISVANSDVISKDNRTKL